MIYILAMVEGHGGCRERTTPGASTRKGRSRRRRAERSEDPCRERSGVAEWSGGRRRDRDLSVQYIYDRYQLDNGRSIDVYRRIGERTVHIGRTRSHT